MENDIAATEFDIALLGCGAYGLPLAAHVKRLGRKSVHIGGACQVLFGIKGLRWDGHELISRLYNEHWVRPRETERPAGYLAVEAGCDSCDYERDATARGSRAARRLVSASSRPTRRWSGGALPGIAPDSVHYAEAEPGKSVMWCEPVSAEFGADSRNLGLPL